MRISRVILLSTLSLICLKGGFAYADIHPFIPVAGTHTHITHNTLTQNHPLLSHLRGERSVRCWLFRTERSAMLTSCLPQALSNSLPEVGRAGGRKNFRWKFFSTPGESLLTGELVETTQSQCYKPRDRSGVSEGRAYEARREGMSSEASIPFSSNIEKMSLTGLIPPRELLTRLKSGEFLLPLPQGENNKLNVFKTASVCFITDTGECSGEKFGNSEDISGGNGGTPDYGSPQDLCRDAGFVNTPCPEGATPDSYCPYDASFHSKCACSADYNKTCDTAAGQKGVGSSCGGKYKECCNICDGYTYTSVPAGYVSAGECSSCDGKKYKVKCDPNAYVNGSVCGAQGGSGGSCTDDSGTYYKKCNCPNNYEWNAGQKKCVCATSFKYACNGTGYAGGEGNSCDGKFGKCRCASGYTWDAAAGACVCSGTDWCALNQNCGALGYAQQSCEGAAVKCPFDTSYSYCL